MGNAQSSRAPTIPTPTRMDFDDEKDVSTDISESLSAIHMATPLSSDGSLTLKHVSTWESYASANPKIQLARTILSQSNITSVLTSRSARIADQHVFNHVLDFKTGPVTDQKSSGRCWLFATTNVIRYSIMRRLKLKEFQLSQSYLFFWDKLNKSNYYLELMIEHSDLPIDDRLIDHLSRDLISDGGQWDMVVNLIETYGLVPQSIYPESTHSSLSRPLNSLLKTKLREHALILRTLAETLRSSHVKEELVIANLRTKKEELMKEIYNILTATLGVPPHPKGRFVWEYIDADDKAGRWEGSPRDYSEQFASKPFSPGDSFSIIHDPRNEYSTLYTVDKLGNIWGGRPILYVNTEIENLKAAVVKMIKAGQPVFFGCDVGQSSDTATGIMDTALFEYQNAFDISLGLTKADRLQMNDSAMTHAMVISGVHLDPTGKPVRYKVENSWGEKAGKEGYFIMTDAWFEQYVYQIVVPKALAPRELVQVFEAGDKVTLPPWDPLWSMSSQLNARSGVSFFQMVSAAMAFLKLKEKYDQYKQVSGDDEEGRVALTSPYADNPNDEGGIALLDTELPARRARKKKACCMCCGLDCSLFWKAIAIALGLSTIYFGIQAIRWAFTTKPTGLEKMPAFSTSLGCVDAPHLYNGSKVTFTAPMGTDRQDHSFDTRGGAIGTFTLADGEADAQEIKYEMVLRMSDEALLKDVYIDYPEYNDDQVVTTSRIVLTTPHSPTGSCVRFDITMYVPPCLKKLHIASHTTAHVQFAPGARINTEDLFITLFSPDSNNIIVPSEHVTSQRQALEVFRGWIVGDASIVQETSITTQRGDGVANVKLHPSPPSDPSAPELATLRTTTGAGRSDFFYIGEKAFKRPIDSIHTSSRNADMYLTYSGAEFSGKIEMSSKSFSMTGAQKIAGSIGTWTHFAGDMNGGDKISVSSRGWTGLYF